MTKFLRIVAPLASVIGSGWCLYYCCGLQIKPVEEQLKQRVIGQYYCISRKRKSYKGITSRSRLAVCLSNVS